MKYFSDTLIKFLRENNYKSLEDYLNSCIKNKSIDIAFKNDDFYVFMDKDKNIHECIISNNQKCKEEFFIKKEDVLSKNTNFQR